MKKRPPAIETLESKAMEGLHFEMVDADETLGRCFRTQSGFINIEKTSPFNVSAWMVDATSFEITHGIEQFGGLCASAIASALDFVFAHASAADISGTSITVDSP